MRVARVVAVALATVGLLAGSGAAASARAGGGGPQGQGSPTRADFAWFLTRGGAAVNVSGTYTPLVGNFDADDHDDILWYAPGTTKESIWSGQGDDVTPFVKHADVQSVNGTYTPIVGDFAGSEGTDVLWYAPGAGADSLWISNGDNTFTAKAVSIQGSYAPHVLHDTAPARDAILWTTPGGGASSLWQFDASGGHSSYAEAVPGNPTILTGDFDGNGLDDAFLYNPGNGADALWRRSSPTSGSFTKSAQTVSGTYTPLVEQFSPASIAVRPAAVLPDDGPKDILWTVPGTGSASLWQGSSAGTFTKVAHGLPLGTPVALHEEWGYVVTYGTAGADHVWYDNDGDADYSDTTGNAKAPTDATPIVGDFQAVGQPGILWYRPGSASELLFIPNVG